MKILLSVFTGQSILTSRSVGKAFEAMQTEAVLRSHSNNPIGKATTTPTRSWKSRCRNWRASTRPTATSSSGSGSQREALERCWLTKAQNQRDRWKHPDAVKPHCFADCLKILRRT